MNDRPNTNQTVKQESSRDSLDAGLVAAFGSEPVACPPPAEGDLHLPDRYDLAGEIARGGMGVVLHGHDRELCRELAVKVLLDKHAGDAGLIQRFVEEAQ